MTTLPQQIPAGRLPIDPQLARYGRMNWQAISLPEIPDDSRRESNWWLVIPLATLILLMSCHAVGPIQTGGNTLDLNGQQDAIIAEANGAHHDLIADPPDLESADARIIKIPPQAEASKLDNSKISAERDKWHEEADHWQATYTTYITETHNDWFGPRTHRLEIKLGIIAGILAVGIILVKVSPLIGGPVGGIIYAMGHACWLFIVPIFKTIGSFIAWIWGKFETLGDSVAAKYAPAKTTTIVVPQ